MRIHLIAIGGAVMHNLALALQKNGHSVTGSDDEIYDPAKSRLEKAGLLPAASGWYPEKIAPELDAVILGMHARPGNPELTQAHALGLPVFSFPEFIFQHAREKTRVVVAGSHGKTTTTAMIMHVLKQSGRDFDYLAGAQLEGFDAMVRLSDAPVMVIEGDEYLSSPIDRRPKFLHYRPQIAIITGIAWDHINVFPTFEEYKQQFGLFMETMSASGLLIFYEKDEHLQDLLKTARPFRQQPYSGFPYAIEAGKTVARPAGHPSCELQIFGAHNLANLQAAWFACRELGISETDFWRAASTFKGAAKRLQLIAGKPGFNAWQDFAHAPSKVKATVDAVSQLYPERELVACVELHTFSSLNKDFLPQYKGTLAAAGLATVFYSPHTLAMKNMPPIEPEEIRQKFGHPNLLVFTERSTLEDFLSGQHWNGRNLLLMSSGTFGGMDYQKFVEKLRP
ncbi:MAG: peptidoglycan synthetase [Saprospiraceae bacterium]|nr:MAG: peptidoglycan synthetase [Saprospiraceae bacterium]